MQASGIRSLARNEDYGAVAESPNLHLLTEAKLEQIVLEKIASGEGGGIGSSHLLGGLGTGGHIDNPIVGE